MAYLLKWEECKAHLCLFKLLKEYAKDYNHRVIYVEYIGKQIVYNGTVDDNHNLCIFDNVVNDDGTTRYVTTMQCGEQIFLPANSSCNLLSINLLEHLKNNSGVYDIDYNLLKNTIRLGVDYLDTAIDEEKYTDEIIEKKQKYYRQIGLGIMGWADLLIMLGIRYGSDKSLEVAEEVAQFMLDKAYMYSALRDKKYGRKHRYGKEHKMNDHYLKLCSKETQNLVNKYGFEGNSTIMSIAPTGSIAMMHKVNGGIRTIFCI